MIGLIRGNFAIDKIVGDVVLIILVGGMYGALPVSIVVGWITWIRKERGSRASASASLISFGLTTVSAVLAFSTILYAKAIGGFPYYDPTLLKIYRWGSLLSAAAIILAFRGMLRANTLRWYALGCSFGILLFWVIAASHE